MKKLLCLIIIVVCLFCLWQRETVTKFIAQKIIYKDSIVIKNANEYYKNYDFLLTQNTDEFIIKNQDQFLNIVYTMLNYGWNEFSFFCDYSYQTCTDDFLNFVDNTDYVQTINNYVNPLNSYSSINFAIDTLGKITVTLENAYTKEQIDTINNIINIFIKQNINASMNDKQKIKLFHDFIIENTIYDQNYRLDMDKSSYSYHPYSAYGPLVEGKGICSGYSDAMAIFLDKIGVKNFKVSNEEHIWNVVYLDSNWYHIDLTWDDPVISTGEQVLLYDFYLISTNELKNKDTSQHKFDPNNYLELK